MLSLAHEQISKMDQLYFCLVSKFYVTSVVHLYSSQAEANQFTGMVYQGLLLSERKRLRTESIEEHITPNSAPAQWPGTRIPAFKTTVR